MSRKFTKKPADHCGAGFWVIFRDIYTTVTSILKIEGPFQFWLITQSILNGFGWFLARKIVATMLPSQRYKTRG
jgi:hypothetical protein